MSRLEELFLGRERVVTVTGGRKLRVRQLPGTDIFIAADGSFVMPRWRGVVEGKTPYHRRQKRWTPKELRYVVYPQGLSVALRSRQLALFQAEKILWPTYQKALAVFAEEVRGLIITEKTVDPRNISGPLRRKLQTLGFVFQRAQKTGVKEAMVKILFLYQDESANLNVGAMLARTVAITDRLRERLLGLYAWIRKYQSQEKVLEMIQSSVHASISQAAKQMKDLSKDPVMIQGGGERNDWRRKLVADRLTTLALNLEPLSLLQPFSRWMTFVAKDFDEMLMGIKEQDYVLARALIERILFSIQLKRVQVSLDRLLLRVGQEAIIKKPAWNDYAAWTESLGVQLSSLIAQEAYVGLREKVCQQAGEALCEASEEASGKRRLSHFKAAVKRACVVL